MSINSHHWKSPLVTTNVKIDFPRRRCEGAVSGKYQKGDKSFQ